MLRINILINRSFNSISKRYLSTEYNDVFKAQDRGLFHDNLAEVEYVRFEITK